MIKNNGMLILCFALVAYSAGATGYILAGMGDEPIKEIHYVDDDFKTYNTEADSLSELSDAVNRSGVTDQEYIRRVYDCREYSISLVIYLKMQNYNAGTCTFRYLDDTGHRIVWVKMNNETVYIEPQNGLIMHENDLQGVYNNNIKTITLHDYDVEVSRDKVIVLEN